MGFYFRKSKKFGGFRLNFSKSGIGVSSGIKGFRYSVGPRGAFITIGRNGIYYRKKIAGGHQATHHDTPEKERHHFVDTEPDDKQHLDWSELPVSSSNAVIDDINRHLAKPAYAGLVRIGAIIIALCMAQLPPPLNWILGWGVLIFGFVRASRLGKTEQAQRTTPLFFHLEPPAQSEFDGMQAAFAKLEQSQQIWRILGLARVTDVKRNAGAGNAVSRVPASAKAADYAPFIVANVEVPSIKTDGVEFYFFPDQLLVFKDGRYGSISYSSLHVVYHSEHFVEETQPPADAESAGYTWRYVNKDGGPDRRFNNNFKLPVVIYGYLELMSGETSIVILQTSSRSAAWEFSTMLKNHSDSGRDEAYHQEADGDDKNGSGAEQKTRKAKKRRGQGGYGTKSPYDILGVEPTASGEEIAAAYHRMVKLYHPDQVATMGLEFQELAEKRMREINGAYEELKNRV